MRIGLFSTRTDGLIGRRSVSLELARAGLATVYEQAGAVYGRDGLPALKAAESYAKYVQSLAGAVDRLRRSRRLGMWSQANVVSPAQFKASGRT